MTLIMAEMSRFLNLFDEQILADDPEEEHRNLEASPSKALRAATLKSRFADTIFRAQEKLVLHKVTSHYEPSPFLVSSPRSALSRLSMHLFLSAREVIQRHYSWN